MKHVSYDEKVVSVTFRINKKARLVLICQDCMQENSIRAKFCRECGVDITRVEPIVKGKPSFLVTKNKAVEHFCSRHFLTWITELRNLECAENSYIFPPYNRFKNGFLFHKHLTTQRFDQVLQKLDSPLTSHMFRYGAAEKYLRRGYSLSDLMEIGDWASITMPKRYAEKKGLTEAQRRFAVDV